MVTDRAELKWLLYYEGDDIVSELIDVILDMNDRLNELERKPS